MWLDDITEQLLEEASALDLFDANAWLGRSPYFSLMSKGTPGVIQDLHGKCHVTEALISHWLTWHNGSNEGNGQLLSAVEEHPNWYAAVTLHPVPPGGLGVADTTGLLSSNKVRAVRVFPATHNYTLADWCFGPLCELLIDRRLPLIIFHSETSFQEIHDLAKRYPNLHIVLDSQMRKILYHTQVVLQLMQSCRNIYLEISNYCAQGVMEHTVEALGPERLIFGTFLPANDPLIALGLLLQADISQEAKRAIGGGNMRRLISEVRL